MGVFDDIIAQHGAAFASASAPSTAAAATSLQGLFQQIAQKKAQQPPPPNDFKPMPGVDPASPMIVNRWTNPTYTVPPIPVPQGPSLSLPFQIPKFPGGKGSPSKGTPHEVPYPLPGGDMGPVQGDSPGGDSPGGGSTPVVTSSIEYAT